MPFRGTFHAEPEAQIGKKSGPSARNYFGYTAIATDYSDSNQYMEICTKRSTWNIRT